MTPLPTVYAVDAQGNYLGGFAGCIVTESVPETQTVRVEVDSGLLDAQEKPVMRMEDQERTVYIDRQRTIAPSLPAGAVLIDAPPLHGAAVLKAGAWDYSAVPDDVRKVLGA